MHRRTNVASTKQRHRHVATCFLPQTVFVLLGVGLWGGGFWLLLPLGFLMLLVPILDRITGWQDAMYFDQREFSGWEVRLLAWNPRAYAALYIAAATYVAINTESFSGWELATLVATLGLLGGIAFAAAHELMHARGRVDQLLQQVVTVFLFYPHYKLIHLRSHHRHGATRNDTNTAWLNESIYAYIRRTIPESAARCWELETRRHRGDDGKWTFRALVKNRMVAYAIVQIVLVCTMYLAAGVLGMAFYMAQIAVAHLVFESVNYMQHYGLMRRQHNGKYETTNATHSWDTYDFFSSYLTFRVGHHSFHHLGVQPYYLLDAEPDAPKLPFGYFWAIPVAFVPLLWRRLINPRLPAIRERSESEVSGVRSRPERVEETGQRVA